MALFIQSGNALVSRVAQWVGAIPTTTGLNATAFNSSTGVITTSASANGIILVGDFIGTSILKPYTTVLAVSGTSVTVSDIEGIWAGTTYPTAILKLPTQSTSEILSSIQLCELKMRTIELPALRSDPYGATPSTLLTDSNGFATIPADMNKPILFFQETPNSAVPPGTPAASMGPWIIYDRVGDREIIRRRMIDQLYVHFGVPRVIRASFSEVGNKYIFTPNPGENVRSKRTTNAHFHFCLDQQTMY